MARRFGTQYPGAIYHVMNRGDRREAIFADDQDRQRFLDTLGEACQCKLRIAERLGRETTMTLDWIAERLQMGTASHVACLLYRAKKMEGREPVIENTVF